MTVRLAADTRDAFADLVVSLVSAGSGPGQIDVYPGDLPDDLDPGADVLLASFVLTDPAAAAAALGVATLDTTPPIDATIAADGTPGYFLLVDSDDNPVLGGTVGTTGADLLADSVDWIAAETATLTAGTITQPLEDN